VILLPSFKHLSLIEREKFLELKAQGHSLRSIASTLGRSHSTLSREISRYSKYGKPYVPCLAQKRYEKITKIQRSKAPLKSLETYLYVREKLKLGWSPESIAGRLTIDYPKLSISPESIYAHIYSTKNKKYKLWEFLTIKRKKRMKKLGRKTRRSSKIPHAISIHLRPKFINNRRKPGHWETDLMEGTRKSKSAVSVAVERFTRKTHLSKLKSKKAFDKVNSLNKVLNNYPANLRRSLTNDNGAENSFHLQTSNDLNMKVFFCHPYHS
jgi:transposase, IS30 family